MCYVLQRLQRRFSTVAHLPTQQKTVRFAQTARITVSSSTMSFWKTSRIQSPSLLGLSRVGTYMQGFVAQPLFWPSKTCCQETQRKMAALFPGHSQILSLSCGEFILQLSCGENSTTSCEIKSGSGLGMRLGNWHD